MSYCVLFCALYRKESANKRYRNTVNNLISPNTVSQNDEKPHTAELDDTAIPHVKIEITEIPHEKSPIPQYRKVPCPPPPHPPSYDRVIVIRGVVIVFRVLVCFNRTVQVIISLKKLKITWKKITAYGNYQNHVFLGIERWFHNSRPE